MDTELAWAAGFIDGEGTITLKRYYRHGRIVYQPYLTVAQAEGAHHFEAIEYLQKLFGGSLARHTPKPPRTKTLQWIVASRKAIEILKLIRPYLRIKYVQADLLVRYYENLPERDSYYRIPEQEHLRRGLIFDEMRTLNLKGKLRLQRLSETTPLEMQQSELPQ